MSRKSFSRFGIGFLIFVLAFSVGAQTRRKPVKKKQAKTPAAAETKVVVESVPSPEIKKNTRPEASESRKPTGEEKTGIEKTGARPVSVENKPVYFYEFTKSDFTVSKIYIEHDENGKGKITFQKKDLAEPETEPLQLSPAALERIKTVWQALNFLDSNENYQAVRDYSNLGTMKFSMKKNGRQRDATFNWTDNKDAKALADEYRKIGQQLIWIFEMSVARENQPLDAPRLMDSLAALVRRKELSDAAQMIPLLQELAADERIPLIARNHSKKLIEKIEKEEKKKTEK